eukprot:Em0084g11a
MEDVCNFFPTDAKQLYEEALKEGSVKLSIIKCLVLGIAGVGKTCLKRFLLQLPQNEDGPIGRVSTGLADNPIEVLVGSVDSILMGVDKKDKEKWEVLDEAKLIEVIVHSCGSNISSPAPNNVRESQSHDMPTSTTASEREYHPEPAIEEVNRQIINIFKSKKLYGKEFYVNLIHFIDSGGQPQFIELLPAFVQDLNAILYAVNLSESLDHHPTIYFYGQNCQPIGTPYQSPFSHGQVLQKCVRATYTTDVCPQVFVVGTHRDKQNECAEKREDKDRMIKKLVPTNCLVQRNEPQVLWDVNGIKPDLYDQDIANHLRRAIVHHCTNNELSASLPMKWFVLRMWITSFAEQGVLSLRRCLELAQKLSMDQSDLEAALLHMVDYNLFLWYPKIPELRDVVISDPQVILKIITHLVQCKHDLSALSNDAGDNTPCSLSLPVCNASNESRPPKPATDEGQLVANGLAHLLGKHQLRPEDLDDVFSYVQAASPKWVSHLKMSSMETSAIVNTTGLSDQKDYFQEMLTKWLTLAPPQHPIPTTEALAEAIGKAWSVNLAFKLKKEAMFVGPERVITPENEFLRP